MTFNCQSIKLGEADGVNHPILLERISSIDLTSSYALTCLSCCIWKDNMTFE